MVIVGVRFPAPHPVEGIAGAPSAIPCLGRTLAEQQDEAMRRAGVRPGADDPGAERLLIREDVLARPEAIRALIAEGRTARADRRWGVDGEAGRLAERLGLGREEGPLLVYLRAGGPASDQRISGAAAVNLPSEERALPIPLAVDGAPATLPVTDRLVLPMGHWCQALWANLLGLGPFLWQEILGRNPVLALARLAWAALRSLSLRPERVMGAVLRRGRRCRIHPSAVVEACWLGDGVQVGAGAVVRASVLGDGAIVEDQAMVEGCSLGPGARVQRQAMVKYSVLAEGCAFGGTMQLGVLDRGCVVKHGAVLMDMAWGRPVRVMVGKRAVEAPFGLLGVCVGERTVLGAGVQVAPGRAVPAELVIVAGGGAVLRRIPEDARGLLEVRDGELVART